MPTQLQKGDTFVDGQLVNAARLNNLVDAAIALKGVIGEQAPVTAATNDFILLTDTSDSGNLRKALVSSIPGAVSSVALTMPSPFSVAGSPITTSGTLAVTIPNQTLGKFYASPATSTGQPVFREIASRDLAVAPVAIAASTIDWTLANVFTKGLTANLNPTLTGGAEGQTIYVHLFQTGAGNFTVTWPGGVRWDGGGTPPVQTVGVNRSDIYQFWLISTQIYGKRIVANAI